MAVPGEIIHVPADPGVTYTRDNLYHVIVTNGVATAVTDSYSGGTMICKKTMTATAATTYFPSTKEMREWDDTQTEFVPMEWAGPQQMIYAAKLAGYSDETVVSYTASTRAVAVTTGWASDNRPAGALAYVYEGPGAGEINIVESYDHAGGAAALLTVFHRAFKATLTTSSKMIVLASTAAANAVSVNGLMDPLTSATLDTDDGVGDGPWMVYPSWRDIATLLPTGALPVIPRLYEVPAAS